MSFKLAEMSTKVYAAELMTRHAGALKEEGKPMTQESAMAKLYASEISTEVANEAVQVFRWLWIHEGLSCGEILP